MRAPGELFRRSELGAEALERVDEIAAVDGVDILFIGTNDLCAELGIDGQFEHELVRKAYIRTIEACRARGKHVGVGGLAGRTCSCAVPSAES